MKVNTVLLKGSNSKVCKKYITIQNQEKKKWILPIENLKTGLNIYQPSSSKGKLAKKFIPYLIQISFFRRVLNIEVELYNIEENFQKYINKLFGKSTVLSFFLGTPSIHQKTTIQISEGNKILGYCKITNNLNISELFNREIELLQSLEKKAINKVPRYLGSYKSKDMNSFCQSTTKTKKSYSPHVLNNHHFEFLSEVFEKTKQEKLFEETDYADMLKDLKINVSRLNDTQKKVIQKVIEIIEKKYTNQKLKFGLYHGDFTPWNMFIEKEELFVFDFEYSKKTYPIYLDMYHFFTQVKMHVENKNNDQIYDEYLKKKEIFNKYVEDSDFYYLQYLLEVINLYLGRSNGELEVNERNNIIIWINLLEKIIN